MSNVKRSTYQKLAEENKKLKKEIRILIAPPKSSKGIEEGIAIRKRYAKQYEEEAQFKEICKEMLELIKKKEEQK